MLVFAHVSALFTLRAQRQILWTQTEHYHKEYFTFKKKNTSQKKDIFGSPLQIQFLPLSRQQHPTKQQLYGHLPPIMKTIKVRRTRYAGHCWRSRYELISDVLLWTPSHGRAKTGRPARTYIQQLLKTYQKQWTIEKGGSNSKNMDFGYGQTNANFSKLQWSTLDLYLTRMV